MSIVNSGIDVAAVAAAAKVPRGGTAKRLFDVIFASALLFALLPLMLFVALAIFSTERGSVFYGHDRIGARYKEYSPFHNVSADDPPTIVLCGSMDKLLPVKTLEAFKAAMEKVGVRCENRIYEGQPHGFFNYRTGDNKYYYETALETDKFLASLGWLEGPPTLKVPNEAN